MKTLPIILALVLVAVVASPAVAELEDVTVAGSIQVRGQLQTPGVDERANCNTLWGAETGLEATILEGPVVTNPMQGQPLAVLIAPPGTPPPGSPQELIQMYTHIGVIPISGNGSIPVFVINSALPPFTLTAPASFNDDINALDWWTQRTRVNVDARFSGGVRAFVELQAYDFWGVDDNDLNDEASSFGNVSVSPIGDEVSFGGIAGQGDSIVQLYQAYIEMNNLWDYPLSIRVGRQELVEGREWLIGNNDAGVNFSGLAFDGIRASYDADLFRLDAWWTQLADFASPLVVTNREADANVDFAGVYGTYKGVENMAIDAYFLWVRNPNETFSIDGIFPISPGADVMNLFTVGGRIAGAWDMMGWLPGVLDYNIEGAAQFGDSGRINEDGDTGEFGGWAFNAMLGYTFSNVAWTPRLEAEYAFFSGDDDIADGDTDEFVRLFSDVHYGELNLGGNLDANATNLHVLRLGVSAVPLEKLTVKGDLYGFWLAEDEGLGKTFGVPQLTESSIDLLGISVPVISPADADDSVGWELDLVADYQYTEDLNLRVGWAHFFPDDAIENSWGAGEDDSVDYLYLQALLIF